MYAIRSYYVLEEMLERTAPLGVPLLVGILPLVSERNAEFLHNEVPVRRIARGGPLIEEQYAITPHGIVEVTIRDLDTGYARVYPVGA